MLNKTINNGSQPIASHLQRVTLNNKSVDSRSVGRSSSEVVSYYDMFLNDLRSDEYSAYDGWNDYMNNIQRNHVTSKRQRNLASNAQGDPAQRAVGRQPVGSVVSTANRKKPTENKKQQGSCHSVQSLKQNIKPFNPLGENTTPLVLKTYSEAVDIPAVVFDIRFSAQGKVKSKKHKSLKSQGYDPKRTRWPETPGPGHFKVWSNKIRKHDRQPSTVTWFKGDGLAHLTIYHNSEPMSISLAPGTYTRDTLLRRITEHPEHYMLYFGCSVIRDDIKFLDKEYVLRTEGRMCGGSPKKKPQKKPNWKEKKQANNKSNPQQDKPEKDKEERESRAIKGSGGAKKGVDFHNVLNQAVKQINSAGSNEMEIPRWADNKKLQQKLADKAIRNLQTYFTREGYRSRAVDNGRGIEYEFVPISVGNMRDKMLPLVRTPPISDDRWLYISEGSSDDPERAWEFLKDIKRLEELGRERKNEIEEVELGGDIAPSRLKEDEFSSDDEDNVDTKIEEIEIAKEIYTSLNALPEAYKNWFLRSTDDSFFLTDKPNTSSFREREPVKLPPFNSPTLRKALFSDKVYLSKVTDELYEMLRNVKDEAFPFEDIFLGMMNGGKIGNYTGLNHPGDKTNPGPPVNRSDAISWLHDKLYNTKSRQFEKWTIDQFTNMGNSELSMALMPGLLLKEDLAVAESGEGDVIFIDSGLPGGGKIAKYNGEEGWEEDNAEFTDAALFLPKAYPYPELLKMNSTSRKYHPGGVTRSKIRTDARRTQAGPGLYSQPYVEHYSHDISGESSRTGQFPRGPLNIDGTYVTSHWQPTLPHRGDITAQWDIDIVNQLRYEPVWLSQRPLKMVQDMTVNPLYQPLSALVQSNDVGTMAANNRDYMISNLGDQDQLMIWARDRNLAMQDLKYDMTLFWIRVLKYLSIMTTTGPDIARGGQMFADNASGWHDHFNFNVRNSVDNFYGTYFEGYTSPQVEMVVLNISQYNSLKYNNNLNPAFFDSSSRTLFLHDILGSGTMKASYTQLDYVFQIAGLMGTDFMVTYMYDYIAENRAVAGDLLGKSGFGFDTSAIFVEKFRPQRLVILTNTDPGQPSGLRYGQHAVGGIVANADIMVSDLSVAAPPVVVVDRFLGSQFGVDWMRDLNSIYQLAQKVGTSGDLDRAMHFFSHNCSVSAASWSMNYYNTSNGGTSGVFNTDEFTIPVPLAISAALYETVAGPSNGYVVEPVAGRPFYYVDNLEQCHLYVQQETGMEFMLLSGICVALNSILPSPVPSARDAWYDRLWAPVLTNTLYASGGDMMNMPEPSLNIRQENVQFPKAYTSYNLEYKDGSTLCNRIVQMLYPIITGTDAGDFPVTTFTWRPSQFQNPPANASTDVAYALNVCWASPIHSYIMCDRLPLFAGIVTNPSKLQTMFPYEIEEDDFVRPLFADSQLGIQTHSIDLHRRKPFISWKDDPKITTTQVSIALMLHGVTAAANLYLGTPGVGITIRGYNLQMYSCPGRCAAVANDVHNSYSIPLMLPLRNILVYNQRLQQYTQLGSTRTTGALSVIGNSVDIVTIRGGTRGARRIDNGFQVTVENDDVYAEMLGDLLGPSINNEDYNSLRSVKSSLTNNKVDLTNAPKSGGAAESGPDSE